MQGVWHVTQCLFLFRMINRVLYERNTNLKIKYKNFKEDFNMKNLKEYYEVETMMSDVAPSIDGAHRMIKALTGNFMTEKELQEKFYKDFYEKMNK